MVFDQKHAMEHFQEGCQGATCLRSSSEIKIKMLTKIIFIVLKTI
jgi:hypothetical protein